jgi:hypothetical protein
VPLKGCRCRVCRMYSDGEEIARMLREPPKALPPDQQALLNKIVREAWEKVKAKHPPQPAEPK